MKIKIKTSKIKNTIIKFLKEYYPLLTILLIASITRLYHLETRGNFWFDEWFTLHFSTLPSVKDSLHFWILETNPPLHMIFMRFYLFLTGVTSETMVRLPSLLFGLSSIILIYFTAKKFFNKNTAIWSALLLTFSGLFIDLNTENRVYSLLLSLSIVSLLLFYNIAFEKKNKKIYWILYFIANLLLLYSHLTAVLIPIMQLLGLILVKANKKLTRKFLIINFSIGFVWLLWFLPHAISILNVNTASAWYFNTSNNFFISILYSLVGAFTVADHPQVIFAISILIILTMVFLAKEIYKAKDSEKTKLIFLSFYFLFPIICSTILGVIVSKYYTAFYPALFIIFARMIDLYTKNSKTTNPLKRKKALYFVLSLIFLPLTFWTVITPYFSLKEFTDYIRINKIENSIIITPQRDKELFKKYYNGDLAVLALSLKKDNYTNEEKTVKYNFIQETTTKPDLKKWIDENMNGKNQIFLLEYSDSQKLFEQTLTEKNWKLVYKKDGAGRTRCHLKEFKKI